jgi:thiosulfate dehydrogenase
MFKGFVLGFIIALVVIAGGAYYYFSSGMAPVATSDPPMPFEKHMANMALDAHIANEHLGPSPVAADAAAYTAGAAVYKDHCALCHGLPNQPPPTIASGMYPHPPMLFRGKGVTDDPASETYWKVANGIRLTGMPSFKSELNDTQMWEVAQLLANANKIPDSVRESLMPAPAAAAASAPQAPESQKERSKAIHGPSSR